VKKQKADVAGILVRVLFVGVFMTLVSAYSGKISFHLFDAESHELSYDLSREYLNAILPSGNPSGGIKKCDAYQSHKFHRLFLYEEQKLLPDNIKTAHRLKLADQEIFTIRPLAYYGFFYQRVHISGDHPLPRS